MRCHAGSSSRLDSSPARRDGALIAGMKMGNDPSGTADSRNSTLNLIAETCELHTAITSALWWVCFLVILGLMIDEGARVSADDSLARYYAGLRERGLFRLAESDCLRRLAGEISPTQRAELTIELSQMYVAHALQRTGDEREELWERAAGVVDDVLPFEFPDGYHEMLLAQRAMVEASRGTQLRWQVELFPLDEPGREQAANTLRRALELFKPLPTALSQRMSELLARPSDDAADRVEPPPWRLRELRRTVEFRAAVAAVDLAKVLPTGPERTAVLHEADRSLRELTKTPRPDEASWIASVLVIEVSRLRGDLDRVGPQVAALFNKQPPDEIRDMAAAQWVRSELDAGQPAAALERVRSHLSEHGPVSEELSGVLVETLLACRRLALEKEDDALARDLLSEAESCAARMSGAWGDRSRLQIEAAREADVYGPVLAESIYRAKWAWRNGNLEEAIGAYHRAVREAHRSGRGELAVELAITLATLQTEARQFEGAAVTLGGLLDSYPDSPRAAEAHLLHTYALGRLFERSRTDERKQAYEESLEAHRSRYADSPTLIEATWMLARLREHERDWASAVALLESIPVESRRGEEAGAHLAIVYDQALSEMRQRGETTDIWEQRAVVALNNYVEAFPPSPEPLSPAQAEIAWRLARLVLGQRSPDFVRAHQLLERIVPSGQAADTVGSHAASPQPPLDRMRLAEAAQLRIVCLAGQGRLDQAREALNQLESVEPGRVLDVLNGLADAAEVASLENRHTVATLQLELARRFDERRATLSDDQQMKLDESLAQAYAALGQHAQAAAVYEKLLWQRPGDPRLMEALARLYESSGTIGGIRNAAKQWQALERQQPKGSFAWLETRYHLAWCYHRLGDDRTARKLIGVTRVLYPELGGPALKSKFDRLESELERIDR